MYDTLRNNIYTVQIQFKFKKYDKTKNAIDNQCWFPQIIMEIQII